LDLSTCPVEITALDQNAEKLWPQFLRRTGVSMSVDRKRVIDNESRRALIIRSFGVPSLIQRLAAAKDERDRARVWWREASACSEGESSISDLSTDNLFVLNPFIVTPELKYPDPRTAYLERARACRQEKELERADAVRRGRPRKSDAEKRQSKAEYQRRFRKASRSEKIGLQGAGHVLTEGSL